jgi:Family of unknown function (DUF6498)
MPNAFPCRIRFTLFDREGADCSPLELPVRRMWPVGVAIAAMFLLFAGVEWIQISKLDFTHVRGVSDLMFTLFGLFWVVGWSVGVMALGALSVLLLLYHERARIQDGKLVFTPRLGPLKIVCEYDLSRIVNLRLTPNSDGSGKVRLQFDYDGLATGLGDWMSLSSGEALIGKIRTALPVAGEHTKAAPAPQRAESAPPTPPSTVNIANVLRGTDARSGLSVSVLALLLANALPLFCVLLFGWDISHVIVLYWAESAVIALFTVLKIFVVAKWMALFSTLFFIGHFGGFMAAHFMFVYGFFVRGVHASGPEPGVHDALFALFTPLWPGLLALAISHGVSFAVNFLGAREWETTTVRELMTIPYRRIVVMHLTVIFGGFLVLLIDRQLPALVLLVLLKVGADLHGHVRERTRIRTRAPVGSAAVFSRAV